VAGAAGKTPVAALLAATLRAAGIHAGLYHAGCEPLSVRVRVDGAPVDEGLLCLAAEAQAIGDGFVYAFRTRLDDGLCPGASLGA